MLGFVFHGHIALLSSTRKEGSSTSVVRMDAWSRLCCWPIHTKFNIKKLGFIGTPTDGWDFIETTHHVKSIKNTWHKSKMKSFLYIPSPFLLFGYCDLSFFYVDCVWQDDSPKDCKRWKTDNKQVIWFIAIWIVTEICKLILTEKHCKGSIWKF